MSLQKVKPIAHLDNWSLTKTGPSEYAAPEQATLRLQGLCTDDHRGYLSKSVVTGTVLELDPVNLVAETKNTTYILGQLDKEYEAFLALQGLGIEDLKIN